MKLEVDGVQYSNFTTASCQLRLDALSNTFSFSAVAADGAPLPFKGGEPCKVTVDGETVLTGNIEVVDVSYDAAGHTINIQGRDKTGDLLDSTLDAIADIRAPITLKALIEAVVTQIGADISVIDEVNPEEFNEAEDIASPEAGDNAFKFIEKYARKRQVILTSNADGNLVITKNTGATSEGAVQHIIGADDNNVMSASFSYDITGRYNLYKFASQLNPVALNLAGETSLASTVNQGGAGSDSAIRAGRQLVLVSESPFSDVNCTDRAEWERDIRRARGLVYAATVPGYRVGLTTGDLWELNTLYQINDDFLGKNEPMLCNSINFTLDVDSGRQTSLGFVDELAYTLETNKPRTSEVASLVI